MMGGTISTESWASEDVPFVLAREKLKKGGNESVVRKELFISKCAMRWLPEEKTCNEIGFSRMTERSCCCVKLTSHSNTPSEHSMG